MNYGAGAIWYSFEINFDIPLEVAHEAHALLKAGFEDDKVMLICNRENMASAKTILANGGVFENFLFAFVLLLGI